MKTKQNGQNVWVEYQQRNEAFDTPGMFQKLESLSNKETVLIKI